MISEKPPILDNRNLEAIMMQLDQKAKDIYGAWEADPGKNSGAMLHMIFARYMELAIERLNKVPDKAFITFLDAMGISMLPTTPANAPLKFTPAEGSDPVYVPKGTRVSVKDSEVSVIFETEDNLTVIPGEIAKLYTIDTINNRYSDLSRIPTDVLYHPFVGKKKSPKVIHIGYDSLFDMNGGKITLSLQEEIPGCLSILKDADFSYYSSGKNIHIDNKEIINDNGKELLDLSIDCAIDETLIKGVSSEEMLRNGMNGRWISVDLNDINVDIEFAKIKVYVDYAKVLPPDAISVNNGSIDHGNNIFYPFGQIPKVGDTFYFAIQNAFSKTGYGDFEATIEIVTDMEGVISDGSKLLLQWEYYSGNGKWQNLEVVTSERTYYDKLNCIWDETNALKTKGKHTIRIKLAKGSIMVPTKVNTETNYWIRVRIAAGDYGVPYTLTPNDASDLNKGYHMTAGTLTPIVINHIELVNYIVSGYPKLVCQQGFYYYTYPTDDNPQAASVPFSNRSIPVNDREENPSFYIGFDQVYPEYPVTIYAVIDAVPYTNRPVINGNRDMEDLKLVWEYFNGNSWKNLMIIDDTNAFSVSGTIKFLMPYDIRATEKIDLCKRFYIRLRAVNGNPLNQCNRIKALYLNTVPSVQAVVTSDEILGSSNGRASQTFKLMNAPILHGQQLYIREAELPTEKELRELEAEEGTDTVNRFVNIISGEEEIWVKWHEVSNFYCSKIYSRHYILDHLTGEITFGDGSKGLIPPKAVNNIKASYRTTTGSRGNTVANSISKLISSIANIDKVTNPEAADGGADAETLDMTKVRGPKVLKSRGRAISAEDFEWILREEAGQRVARVKCLSNINSNLSFENGCVTMVVIPSGNEKKLTPKPELIKKIYDRMQDRVYAGLFDEGRPKITIIGPGYIKVEVEVEIVPVSIDQAQEVKNNVLKALNQFFHPLLGGPSQAGWEFGRDVYASEVYRLLEGVSGVDHVKYEALNLHSNIVQKEVEIYVESIDADAESLYIPEGSAVKFHIAGTARDTYTKCSVLAEAVYLRHGINKLKFKGLKEGDDVRVYTENGIFPVAMTIIAISYDNDGNILASIENFDYDIDMSYNPVLSTWDDMISYKLLAIHKEEDKLTQILLEDVKTDEWVAEIRNSEGDDIQVNAYVESISIIRNRVYIDDNYLVYSGMHHISIVAE